jgi:hypothetical protein
MMTNKAVRSFFMPRYLIDGRRWYSRTLIVHWQ